MKNKKQRKTIIPIENPATAVSKKRLPKKNGISSWFGEPDSSKYHN